MIKCPFVENWTENGKNMQKIKIDLKGHVANTSALMWLVNNTCCAVIRWSTLEWNADWVKDTWQPMSEWSTTTSNAY